MDSANVKLPRLYYGKLLVTDFIGKDASGEPVYHATCECGVVVTRKRSQLAVRKLGACDACRSQSVSARLEDKASERAKDRRVRSRAAIRTCVIA